MSKIGQIRVLVSSGLCYLTEHAYDEATGHGFDIYDIENGFSTGRIRRSWPREGKYEVVGSSLDRRTVCIVCRITRAGKVCIITVYEDRQKR